MGTDGINEQYVSTPTNFVDSDFSKHIKERLQKTYESYQQAQLKNQSIHEVYHQHKLKYDAAMASKDKGKTPSDWSTIKSNYDVYSQLSSSSEIDEDIALSIKSDAVFSAAKFGITYNG
jgi:hypothetical protein